MNIQFLSPEKYEKMDAREKLDLFTDNEVLVHTKSFMNEKSKMNDPIDKKVVTYYQGVCGGVIVSGWKATEQEALEESATCIAASIQSFLDELEEDKHAVGFFEGGQE